MSWTAILVFFHVLAVIWAVTGVIGREVARSQGRRTADLPTFVSIMQLAGRFEERMVRPGSTALAVTGLALAWVQGRPLLGFLQGAQENWLLASNLLVLVTIGVIVRVFIPRGKRYDRALAEAQAQGQVTPALIGTLDDATVRAGHIFEFAALLAVIFLMVVQPF